MKTSLQFAFVFALAASVTTVAFAQEVDNSSALSVPQQCAMLLVNRPHIFEKLELTPTQQAAVQTAEMTHTLASDKLSANKKATEKEWDACDRKLADSLLNALNPTQKQKIFQMGLAKIGIAALADEAIAAKVGLSEIQLNKIQKVFAEHQKDVEDVAAMTASAIEEIPQPKAGADRTAYEKKKVEVYQSYNGERQLLDHKKDVADKKAYDLLTAAQKDKWKDLGGPAPKAK